MLRPLLCLFLVVASTASADLAIVSGGERIIDRDPSSTSSNCFGWVYNPDPVLDENGRVAEMYTVSDEIAGHCKVGIESPFRFGDTIRRHVRNEDGSWSGGVTVLDRSHFPWMSDPSFLAQHPQSFVGHLSSPSVVKLNGRYFMSFVASVNDANLCASEHHASGTLCGSCTDPWSYFVVIWAVSDDGVNWRVRTRAPGDAMLIGRAPDAGDFGMGLDYKGITRIGMITRMEDGVLYFYIAGFQWTGVASDSAIFRIRYDEASEWGITEEPQMWSGNRRTWVECEDGRVPTFLREHSEYSAGPLAFALSRITRTRIFGEEEYLALSSADSWYPGSGRSNVVAFYRSKNLVDWTAGGYISSAIPFLGDTWGYDASMLEPAAIEDGSGTLRLFVASADGDIVHGVERNGRHDCSLGAELGPTAPYVGTGIYEAVLKIVTPSETMTTITPMSESVLAGTPAKFLVRVTASDGSTPFGVVFVSNLDHYGFTSVRLVNGQAEVEMLTRGRGENAFVARFNKQGVWGESVSDVVVQKMHTVKRQRGTRR